jgi:hypothetical protein
MITEIVQQWDKNKLKLEEYFRTTKQEEYRDYKNIILKIFELIINDGDVYDFNISKMKVINDGNRKGTLIFIIHRNQYPPTIDDYIVTDTYYGSCSGCNTLLSISNYDFELPNESQIKEYMTLALHIIQKMHWLSVEE